jgi:hypothetical protein
MKPSKTWFKALVALAVLGAIYWFGVRDPRVDMLNQALQEKGSAALRKYPYAFKVVGMENTVAVMATPRSPQVPVYRMIGAIYPNLGSKAPNDPDFIAAEKELAKVQSEARQIVLDQPGISGMKWELDQNWLVSHGISLN